MGGYGAESSLWFFIPLVRFLVSLGKKIHKYMYIHLTLIEG